MGFDRTCLYWWINPPYVVISITSTALPVMILYNLRPFWISNFQFTSRTQQPLQLKCAYEHTIYEYSNECHYMQVFKAYHSSVFEVSNLPRCGTTSVGNLYPTFWDNLVISSCRNFQSWKMRPLGCPKNVMHPLMQHHIPWGRLQSQRY